MILLKRIQLHDFLSHEDTNLSFHDGQKLLIDGNSGGGKSSIFESIIWALYGQGRSGNASLVRNGTKKATVILTLTDGENEYEITRTISSKGKHTLAVTENGIAHVVSGVRGLQDWIERDLIGASYLLFVNSIAYLQGGSETFVVQSASRRKELLLELIETEDFEEHYELAKQKIEDEQTLIAVYAREIDSIGQWIDDASSRIGSRSDIEANLTEVRKNISVSNGELAVILGKLAEQKAVVQTTVALRSNVDECTRSVKEVRKALDESNDAEKQLNELRGMHDYKVSLELHESSLEHDIKGKEEIIETISKQQLVKTTKLAEKPPVHDYSATLLMLDKQIKSQAESETCPAGANCPHEKNTRTLVEESSAESTRITNLIIKETEALNKWKIEYDELTDPDLDALAKATEQVSKNRAELVTTRQNLKDVESKMTLEPVLRERADRRDERESTLRDREAALSTAQEKLKEFEDEIDIDTISKLEARRDAIAIEVEVKRGEEARYLGDIGAVEMLEKQVPEYERKRSELQTATKVAKERILKLELLKDAFGSRGIRAIAIDYILPSLEERINEILGQMSDFVIRLDTQQEKASGEGMKEGLFITIINELNEEMDFDLFSGGEKVKIITAVTEALASLQRCGFRMLDESITALDENSLEGFMTALTYLQSRYPQILCISHIQEIKDLFEDRVTCRKHGGVSKISTP